MTYEAVDWAWGERYTNAGIAWGVLAVMSISFAVLNTNVEQTNIVPIWSRFSPGHREHLGRWLKAGRTMGLLDAEVVHAKARAAFKLHVLVWVRESADPAYRVQSNGTGWTVCDNIRGNELSRHNSFEQALEAIRPVFSFNNTPPRRRLGGRPGTRAKSTDIALGNG